MFFGGNIPDLNNRSVPSKKNAMVCTQPVTEPLSLSHSKSIGLVGNPTPLLQAQTYNAQSNQNLLGCVASIEIAEAIKWEAIFTWAQLWCPGSHHDSKANREHVENYRQRE